MRKEIHPKYVETAVTCGCGNTFTTRSTKEKINVEICSSCHPFYTGKQKFVDTAGRIERFKKKWGSGKAPVSAEKSSHKGAEKQIASRPGTIAEQLPATSKPEAPKATPAPEAPKASPIPEAPKPAAPKASPIPDPPKAPEAEGQS